MFGMDKLSRHRRWRETRRRTKVRRVAKFVHSKNAFIKRKHAILRVFFILGLSCKFAETSFAFIPAFLRSGLFLHSLFCGQFLHCWFVFVGCGECVEIFF